MSGATAESMTLSPGDLNPTDRLCVRVLREGRATPSYIADVGGYSAGNVRTQLRRLAEHDHVAKVYDGLYQLADDPLNGAEIDIGDAVEQRLQGDRVDGHEARLSNAAEQSPAPSETSTPVPSHTRDAGSEDVSTDAPTDAVKAALAGWSHGRSHDEREMNKAIARRAVEWLRDQDAPVKRMDVPLEQLVDEDSEGRSEETLWTEVVREAWTHATEQGYIEQPSARKYRWVGSDERRE